MSLPELEYLSWALSRYGQIDYDLGQSGVFPLPIDVIGLPQETFGAATDPTVNKRLRAALAQRFNVDEDEAIPVLGTTHGLWCVYAALLSPGDEVLVETPVYEPLVRIAEGLGARVVHFTRTPDIDLDAMRITQKTRLVVVSNLHNPTGAFLDDATITALANKIAPVPLLVDEVYRDLVQTGTSFHRAPNIIVTSSLTKVYGLPWLRAGWVLARAPIAGRVRTAILHSVGAVSWALSSATIHAYQKLDELQARSRLIRAHDEEGARKLSAWVAARPHLRFTPHRGSIFGFVTDTRGGNTRPWIERAIAEERVIVAPGEFFNEPSGFRVRYGAIDHAILDEGLLRLGRAIDA